MIIECPLNELFHDVMTVNYKSLFVTFYSEKSYCLNTLPEPALGPNYTNRLLVRLKLSEK